MKVSTTIRTPSAGWPGYEPKPQFRIMAAIGLVGLFVLIVGGLLFAHFQPVTSPSGVTVKLAVQRYDPQSHTAGGPSKGVFPPREIPAAVVDWKTVPAGVQIQAAWFDSNGYQITATGPGQAREMPAVIPLTDSGPVPVDTYVFAVGRYQDGRMVEVLGQSQVRVGSS
jgi:hypothetical protein